MALWEEKKSTVYSLLKKKKGLYTGISEVMTLILTM